MNFLIRAVKSIWRRPGKSVTLLLLVFVLSLIMVGGIAIRRAIHLTEENLFRNFPPLVTINWDTMGFHESWMEWQANDSFDWGSDWQSTADRNDPSTFPSESLSRVWLTPEDIRAIGASEYVRSFDYSIFTHLYSFELQRFEAVYGRLFEQAGHLPQEFTVRGTSQPNLIQIEQGLLELVQGQQFSEADLIAGQERSVAILSAPFAQANNLTLGSFFTLYRYVMYPDEYGDTGHWGRNEDEIYKAVGMEFEVVGLFDLPDTVDVESNPADMGFAPLDVIYVPNWSVEDIVYRTNRASVSVWDESEMELPFSTWWNLGGPNYRDETNLRRLMNAQLTYLFMLNHPSDFEDFREATKELLPEHYYFVDSSHSISPIISSMEFMREIADWILYGSIIATLIVLTLLILLFLRDRREEIGTYLALGEKKLKVISQILLETAIISLVSITLALVVGNLVSREVSQTLLENEVVYRFEENQALYAQSPWLAPSEGAFGLLGISLTPLTPEEMMDSFDMSLSAETIGIFYAIGLGTVMLSTTFPILYVSKLKPKKILM